MNLIQIITEDLKETAKKILTLTQCRHGYDKQVLENYVKGLLSEEEKDILVKTISSCQHCHDRLMPVLMALKTLLNEMLAEELEKMETKLERRGW